MKKKVILLLVILLIVYGCSQNATGKGRAKEESLVEGNYDGTSTDLESKIKNLENQFGVIKQSNWEVSPEGYSKIKEKLDELNGVNDPRVNNLRKEFSQLNEMTSNEEGLGSLCAGKDECISFCNDNRGRCETYCRGKAIELCRIIFPPDAKEQGPQSSRGCKGTGTVTFTFPPMQIEKIETIEPIGLMIGGHVTPIDHGYYTAKTWSSDKSREDINTFVDVLAPASGIVTSVQSMPTEYRSSSIGDYRIIIHHTCTFYTIYIHVNQLSEKLKAIADTGKAAKVEAGEVIGRAPGFDFSVHNDEVTLDGFIVPEHYDAEPWKIHTVSMFDHFIEPIRNQLLEKNIRQKEPRSGKIDYDIEGKLVGNWFEENTNGYFGKEEYQRSIGYWSTHLAFAYDGLDPDLIIVSMGEYNNEAMQFAVKGNAPDPKDVSVSTGLVKYELVAWQYLTENGGEWDRKGFAKITGSKRFENQVEGAVLAQMIGGRKLKFEAFPGKNAAEISGFTDKAKTYER